MLRLSRRADTCIRRTAQVQVQSQALRAKIGRFSVLRSLRAMALASPTNC